MNFCLILLAAGNSKRFKHKIPKPFAKVAGKTILELSLLKFNNIKQIKNIIVVFNKKHLKFLKKIKSKKFIKVIGGRTRQQSTLKALKYIKKKKLKCSNVLIHDSARPNISTRLIRKIINNSKREAVVPKIQVNDALKSLLSNNKILNLTRENFFLTETPQSYNFKNILNLHLNKNLIYKDDDLSLLDSLKKVKFIEGEKRNFKITSQEDFKMFKNSMDLKNKIGIGFDIHRLVPGRKFYLGGINIKSKLGTLGHSDGDPVLHSIIDAILGACNMGDIGTLFSDKSKKFKNIRSTNLLKKVMEKIKLRGFYINNLDVNIITQTPKINKYRKKIIKNISKFCEISENKINIKGKTTEKLGIIGKERAIASEVIASVIKYD